MKQVPRFAADRMLQRLARWLRLMGADVICNQRIGGAALLKDAREESRVMLTRDKRLRTAPDVLFLHSNSFRDQLREVLAHYPFDFRRLAFTRCSQCNRELRMVSRELVRRRVPPFVYAAHETFAACDDCGRIYWDATHPSRALNELDMIGL
ncbi:MAG: Mut7-C RNAse domain-containing protein [Candidatus Binataceae bacterium]